MFRMLRHFLIGKPLHNEELSEEKLPKWKELAIFFFRRFIVSGLWS